MIGEPCARGQLLFRLLLKQAAELGKAVVERLELRLAAVVERLEKGLEIWPVLWYTWRPRRARGAAWRWVGGAGMRARVGQEAYRSYLLAPAARAH